MNSTMLDDQGEELDANVSLVRTGSDYELTFESSGESGKRNGQYKQAFDLAIKRLRALNAVLQDARVESRVTRDWDIAQKRLALRNANYPVRLSEVEPSTFAAQLRSAGAKVGNASGRGGNPNKRIALLFSVPGGGAAELHEIAKAVIGERRRVAADVLPAQPKLHTWWESLPDEKYWLEITGREDLGADLRAPLTNEQGEPFWSYSLLFSIGAGDIVFHYQRSKSAIVAVSRATVTQWPDSIVWGARGTSARDAGIKPHPRPGWYVGIEDYRPLREPVTLEQMRAASAVLESGVASLRSQVGDPLYFPLELSRSRQLRPMQGYMFKLPRFFVELFPALTAELRGHVGRGAVRPIYSSAYRRADEAGSVAKSDPFSRDPAIVERALQGHAKTQNALADYLVSRGLQPFSPTGEQPNFDVAWSDGSALWVAEVKSLTDENEEKQLRLGLGQVLRYRQLANPTGVARAALVTEHEPKDRTWAVLCESLGIALAWPGNWSSIT
jgi:hypothetical protein